MNELCIDANVNKLNDVLDFINEILEANAASVKAQMQLDIAVEEIFVNIARYAYVPNTGMATIIVKLISDPKSVEISFIDEGVKYNPLEKPDPDTTLSADDRQIGGLGIFMVKKTMDDMKYEYKDCKNILTITKII